MKTRPLQYRDEVTRNRYVSAYHDENEKQPLQLLSIRAEDQGFSVKDDEIRKDGKLRRSLVWPLFVFFIMVNVSVDAGIYTAYLNDMHLIVTRVITPDQV